MEVVDDSSVKKAEVDTVVFCSGKIYYDILEHKEKTGGGENLAIVRLEQLYPLPEKQLHAIVEKYGRDKKYIWMQEEPENMGAWGYILRTFRAVHLEVIARSASGSPAAGSPRIHEQRHQAILDKLFENAKVKA